MTVTEQRFGKGFYQNYFQEPGVAEASLEKDVAATFRLAFSGVRNPEPSEGFLGLFVEPEALPDWLTEEDVATFVEQFTASGFAGGLNWYRNLDRNWERTAAAETRRIDQPACFVTGERDPVRAFMPAEVMRGWVTDLRVEAVVPGAGHWVNQQAPDAVNELLLGFLSGLG